MDFHLIETFGNLYVTNIVYNIYNTPNCCCTNINYRNMKLKYCNNYQHFNGSHWV